MEDVKNREDGQSYQAFSVFRKVQAGHNNQEVCLAFSVLRDHQENEEQSTNREKNGAPVYRFAQKYDCKILLQRH